MFQFLIGKVQRFSRHTMTLDQFNEFQFLIGKVQHFYN